MKNAWKLAKEAVASWSADYAPSMGAALSYYTLFSIAPLLLIVISIAGIVFGPDAARGEIYEQLRGLMGPDGAAAIEKLLQNVNRPREGAIAAAIGFGVLLLGASSVFGELQNDLDRIWRAPARLKSGLWSLLRTRLLSFGMILGMAFLLMVSLVASAALAALSKWYGPAFAGWQVTLHAVDTALSFGFSTLLFAMIYKLMPRVAIQWRDVWTGAAVTALLFAVGKTLIGLYLGRSSVASGFGAAGSLVVVMVWVYYSAQIFLLGAEFTRVYAHTEGSRRDEPESLLERPAIYREEPPLLSRGAKKPLLSLGAAAVLGILAGLLTGPKRGR
ncbi:MAG TPA: YihY/virulence factor BrkB family protein [Burkholderiales bacterium]|nr:YihY/virulence factor BrkB family protein [Burkholderiales bacterium]